MSREHGKGGRVMMGTTASDVPVVVTLQEWSLNMEKDRVDTTSFGDANKTSVTGLANLEGSFSGVWESDEDTIFDAADSDAGVKMYLYPDAAGHASRYWYGLANVSASIASSANDAVKVSGSFNARGSWGRL